MCRPDGAAAVAGEAGLRKRVDGDPVCYQGGGSGGEGGDGQEQGADMGADDNDTCVNLCRCAVLRVFVFVCFWRGACVAWWWCVRGPVCVACDACRPACMRARVNEGRVCHAHAG